MRTANSWTIAVLLSCGTIVGQRKSDSRVKVLTVCEVLGDVAAYANTAVVVVGRVEHSVSLIDHYEFLSQDLCERPVVTHKHVWSNKIQIWGWEEGMPKPPVDSPKLERSILAVKLLAVRKTTKLGSYQQPGFNAKLHSIVYITVPNEWAAVYGRIVRDPDLDKDCGAGGCGGFDAPLMIVIGPHGLHRLREDGSAWPEGK